MYNWSYHSLCDLLGGGEGEGRGGGVEGVSLQRRDSREGIGGRAVEFGVRRGGEGEERR